MAVSNNNFQENVGRELRGYSVTQCPLGLEAEIIKREMIQTIVRVNQKISDHMDSLENYLHYFYRWGLLQSEHFCAKGCCSRTTRTLLFVISEICWMFSTRTCDMFLQRMMLALKESNSVQVTPRKQETLDITRHKGTTFRVGFSTKQAGWVNSKEKNISLLQKGYPSHSKIADWERENIRHVAEGKSWLTTIMKVYYCTRKKKSWNKSGEKYACS